MYEKDSGVKDGLSQEILEAKENCSNYNNNLKLQIIKE